jgi:uncharacterized protein (DUF433 family)
MTKEEVMKLATQWVESLLEVCQIKNKTPASSQGPPDVSITISIRKDVRDGVPCIEGTKSTLDEVLTVLKNMGPEQEIGMWYPEGHPLTYKHKLDLFEKVVSIINDSTTGSLVEHMNHVARMGWRRYSATLNWMKGDKPVDKVAERGVL